MAIDIEQASDRVVRIVGIPASVVEKRQSAELVDVPVNLPVSRYEDARMSCWSIDLGDVPSSLFTERTARPMRWLVLLDAESGNLIEVRLSAARENADLVASPTGAVAREALAAHGETYADLVSGVPDVSLVDALKNVDEAGYASPTDASIVEAHLVVHEWLEHPPRPVWAIVLNGLPPWPVQVPKDVPKPDVPVWQRNHLRHVIDATTSEILFATTIPQPAHR